MRLNPKKTKSMVSNWSQTIAPGYDNVNVGGVEFEMIRGLRILGVTLDSKLTFETYLRKVVSKAARSQGIMRRSGKLFGCPRVLKSCFNANDLFSLKYCIPCGCLLPSFIWVFWIVLRSAERLCEGELCCLGHRRMVSVLVLLYEIYHGVDHPLHEYLNHFVAARNTRASAALIVLALVIPLGGTDQFSRSFLAAAVCVCGTCCRRACLVVTP